MAPELFIGMENTVSKSISSNGRDQQQPKIAPARLDLLAADVFSLGKILMLLLEVSSAGYKIKTDDDVVGP